MLPLCVVFDFCLFVLLPMPASFCVSGLCYCLLCFMLFVYAVSVYLLFCVVSDIVFGTYGLFLCACVVLSVLC